MGIALTGAVSALATPQLTLHYNRPAVEWVEALPASATATRLSIANSTPAAPSGSETTSSPSPQMNPPLSPR